jgi:hypothetical protein
MANQFHYPPEVFSLLVDTIPLLCRGKKDVFMFFRGAGVPEEDMAPMAAKFKEDSKSVNKYEITRHILQELNTRGDSRLTVRREVIKRVTEFEEFSTCWPEDQLKAKGLVTDVRKVVNVKDSFTRMKQERDAERQQTANRLREEQTALLAKKAQIQAIQERLFSLFAMDDKPNSRGKQLESVLNDLFRAYGVLVKEDFRRKDPDGPSILEQIDGVIVLDGIVHLVEMKWLKNPVGVADFAPHLVRLFARANAHGIFISSSDYTEPVIKECASALNQRTMFLCSLKELVFLLQREDDLIVFLRKKSQAAIVEKRPFLEVLMLLELHCVSCYAK